MSDASIAQTMGWSVARVRRRLAELNEASGEDGGQALSACPRPEGASERFTAPPDGPAALYRPIGPGEAEILRSFQAWGGGHAAYGQMADDRRVLIWVGDRRLAPATRIEVEAMPASEPRADEFRWRAVDPSASGGADA